MRSLSLNDKRHYSSLHTCTKRVSDRKSNQTSTKATSGLPFSTSVLTRAVSVGQKETGETETSLSVAEVVVVVLFIALNSSTNNKVIVKLPT